MKIRRVATGHDEAGRSIIASDAEIEATRIDLMPGCEFHDLWGSDEAMRVPNDGRHPQAPGYFPPPQGCRFLMFTIPPESARHPAPADYPSAVAEANRKLPGLLAAMERGGAGMHTTDTVDFDFVVEGEVLLELDDGRQVLLRAGDTIVQNGTRHRWRNPSSSPCRVLACLVSARRN